MEYNSIIQSLITNRGYNSYLEIGGYDFSNFNSIEVDKKAVIEPNPKGKVQEFEDTDNEKFCFLFKDTTETFYDKWNKRKKFDLIFIDGLHTKEAVAFDIKVACSLLKKGGIILLHDVNPPTEWHTRPYAEFKDGEEWCGTAYVAFWNSNRLHPIPLDTLDVKYGLGVIDFRRKPYTEEELDKVILNAPKSFSDAQKAYQNRMVTLNKILGR